MTKHNVTVTTGPRQLPRVEIDGQDIARGLRGLNISIGTDGIPHIEAEIAASAIEVVRLDSVDAEVQVSLSDGARGALVALGWTPPTQDAP